MVTIQAPFQNESEAVEIGGATVENREDRLRVFGDLDITRDKAGLEKARVLQAILAKAVAALEAEPDLPDAIEPPAPTITVADNPFN